MKLKVYSSALAAFAILVSMPAQATSYLWTLHDVTFSDGSLVTGSLTYDGVTKMMTALDIHAASGTKIPTDQWDISSVFGYSYNHFLAASFSDIGLQFYGDFAVAGDNKMYLESYLYNNSTMTVTYATAGGITGVALRDTDPTTVPEPATWALMIGGFAMVGAALRRRTTRLAFA